jgi:hypothetical protein
VNAHKPDAAVVDIGMAPTNTDDGLQAALEIRAALPDAGVRALSQCGLPPAPEDHRRVLAVLAFLRA